MDQVQTKMCKNDISLLPHTRSKNFSSNFLDQKTKHFDGNSKVTIQFDCHREMVSIQYVFPFKDYDQLIIVVLFQPPESAELNPAFKSIFDDVNLLIFFTSFCQNIV